MNIQTYTMFGKPARVLPFAPNWGVPVTETLEWKTDVLKAFDGSEQRRALRSIPRRGFEYRTMLVGGGAELFESMMFDWMHKYFAMPVWTDIGKLSENTAVGQVAIPVSTLTLGFRVNDFAILYASATSYEVFEIAEVGSGTVTSKTGLQKVWPAGTKVYPLILGHLSGSTTSATRHTGRVAEAVLSLNTSPDTAYSNILETSPSAMYDGIEVITAKPNWASTIQNDFSREFDTVDVGVGPIGYYETSKFTGITRPFSWFLKSRADIAAFRALMGRLSGQLKTCWIPSGHVDFTLAGSNALDTAILTVSGVSFHSFVGVDVSRDRLSIGLPDGSTLYRRIIQTTPNYANDTTLLHLDSPINTTVGVNDNPRLQLLLRCRLATDKIVIPWLNDGFSAPQTSFTTVKL